MKARAEPERIEVELTSALPRVGPADASGAVITNGEVMTSGPGRPPRSRRSGVVTVVAVAALALVVGVLVGRAGDDGAQSVDDDRAPPSTVRVLNTIEVVRPDVIRNRTPVPVPPPFASTPGAPVATRPVIRPTFPGEADHWAGPEPERIEVAPVLGSQAMEIVGLTSDGTVLTLDVSTGRMEQRPVEDSESGPPDILAGLGWVLLPSSDPVRRSLVLFDDGTSATVDTGYNWPLLMVAGTDRLWRTDDQTGLGSRSVTEVSVTDGSTGETLQLQGIPQMVDPATGGVVVEAPGGSYVVTVEGAERLTSGRLIALGPSRAFAEECSATLECGFFVIDRASGERRALTLDRALGDRTTVLSSGWWTFRWPMAPTQRFLLVATWDQFGVGNPSNGVLDLETGSYAVITERLDTPQMEWAPSGEIVLWLDSGRLMAYDVAAAESTPVSEELGEFVAFTVRPLATAVDG